MAEHHYYEILKCGYGATDAELRKSYRRLALKYHPDKQADEEAAKAAADQFHLVQRAYSVLSDRAHRQLYNELITLCWRVETGAT